MGNRRRTSTITRLVAALILTMLVATACDWPGYRYGPALTGSNDTERTLAPDNVATAVQQYAVPTGPSLRIGDPVVTGGTVYVTTSYADPPGPVANVGAVLAFRASTGALLWSHPLDGGPTDATTAPGLVLVGLGDQVLALDADTGAVAWETTVAGVIDAPVTVDGGRVFYAATGYGLTVSPIGALDAGTGAPVWTRTFAASWATGPTVGDGRVYVGIFDPSDGYLALGEQDGATIYTSPGHGAVSSQLAFRDGSLYVGASLGHMEAYDAASGALRWVTQANGRGGATSPTVTADTVFDCLDAVELDTQPFDVVAAHDAATGTERWRVPMDCSSIVQANGVLYVASLDTVRVLDARTGCTLATWPLGGNVSDPVVANGSVYVAVNNLTGPSGHLVRFALP